MSDPMELLSTHISNYSVVEDSDTDSPITIPVSTQSLRTVSGSYGIPDARLKQCIFMHQLDLREDDAGILTVTREQLESGDASVLTYTDSMLYLWLSPQIWMREKQWLDVSDSEFDALTEVYTSELEIVSDVFDVNAPDGDWVGVPITIRFPIESVSSSEYVRDDPFSIGVDAEFLSNQVGFSWESAMVFAIAEYIDSDKTEVAVACAEITGLDVDEVYRRLSDVRAVRSHLAMKFSEISNAPSSSSGTIREESVFSYVASSGGLDSVV